MSHFTTVLPPAESLRAYDQLAHYKYTVCCQHKGGDVPSRRISCEIKEARDLSLVLTGWACALSFRQ